MKPPAWTFIQLIILGSFKKLKKKLIIIYGFFNQSKKSSSYISSLPSPSRIFIFLGEMPPLEATMAFMVKCLHVWMI